MVIDGESDRLRATCRGQGRHFSRGEGAHAELAELALPLGNSAPRMARRAVERHLGGHVAATTLEIAVLLVSELVTNGVRHSGAPPGAVLRVRIWRWRDACRLEVEDPGRGGPIRRGVPAGDHGMGLNLVEMLSEHWGVERAVRGPTRVWAELPREGVRADAGERAPAAVRSA